jgi:hypothetical protein
MPIAETHRRFLVSFDAMDTSSAPELTPEAIDVLLNDSQEDFINDIINSGLERSQSNNDFISHLIKTDIITNFTNGTKPNGKLATLPTDYRKMLVERAEISYPSCKVVLNGELKNGEEYVVVEGVINYSNNQYSTGDKFLGTNLNSYHGKGVIKKLETDIVKVKPETRDRYMTVINNPFKVPNEKEVIRLSNSDNQNEIITNKFIFLKKYIIDYIKNPRKMKYGSNYAIPDIDIDCELSVEAENKIIEKALVKASKILKQEQYQIYKQEEILNTIK